MKLKRIICVSLCFFKMWLQKVLNYLCGLHLCSCYTPVSSGLEGDVGQAWGWGCVKQSGQTSPNSITLEQDCKEVKEGAGCVPGKKYPDGGRVREKWDNLCPPQEKAAPRGGASLAPMIPWAQGPGLILTVLHLHHMIISLCWSCSMWDLSSPTRHQSSAPCSRSSAS